MKRIQVDWENSAEEWWHHAGRSRTIPSFARSLIFDGPDFIILQDDEAEALLAWAEELPGWRTGPRHAPTPLTVHEED